MRRPGDGAAGALVSVVDAGHERWIREQIARELAGGGTCWQSVANPALSSQSTSASMTSKYGTVV